MTFSRWFEKLHASPAQSPRSSAKPSFPRWVKDGLAIGGLAAVAVTATIGPALVAAGTPTAAASAATSLTSATSQLLAGAPDHAW